MSIKLLYCLDSTQCLTYTNSFQWDIQGNSSCWQFSLFSSPVYTTMNRCTQEKLQFDHSQSGLFNTPLFVMLNQWVVKLFTQNILDINVRILWILDRLQNETQQNKRLKGSEKSWHQHFKMVVLSFFHHINFDG